MALAFARCFAAKRMQFSSVSPGYVVCDWRFISFANTKRKFPAHQEYSTLVLAIQITGLCFVISFVRECCECRFVGRMGGCFLGVGKCLVFGGKGFVCESGSVF